ncbi:MAG TPA: GMC family oxidoreductase [Candidatus Acidoferrales bacterium]|nr:GMC family oxidoreductase [Candidatus Acidoferrales bacterium]
MLTIQEKRLISYLKTLLVIYLLALVFITMSVPGKFDINVPEAILILTGFAVLTLVDALMCWYAIADIRRYIFLVRINIWESIILSVIGICNLIWHAAEGQIYLWAVAPSFSTVMWSITVFSVLNAVIGSLFLSSSQKARYNLKYFSPLQFRTLAALAEVVIYGEHEVISSEDVAHNVDSYFSSFEAKSKWTMALVISGLYFYPILSLLPPLPYIAPGSRHEFLKKRFYWDVEKRLIPGWWRTLAQGMIRIAKQMCYIGYYNDKRTFASVGYVPFSERKDHDERVSKSPRQPDPPLYVKTEKDFQKDSISGDVVIIGSGAGASILAKGVVESGRKVVMIERGNHERPETFTENEMDMVSRLFQDGAIQAARDFRFTVFQGSCVGGSTVVNNAVCFKIPEPVLDRWVDPKGLNTGLDKQGVMDSMDTAWKIIHANHMDEDKVRLNPGGYLFKKGCMKLGYNLAPDVTDSVNANISGCYGCGYCNIGCNYNKKLSMLVTVLPDIQKKFGKESLEIIAGCEAIKLQRSGNKISYVEGQFNDGRKLKVYGKTFVVAAGAISSSILLLKSKLGIKNAGMRLAFNTGSQLTAAFPTKIDSYDGLQISHYMKILPDTGFIMESWYNPPMFQSTAMPGWFEDHYNNMRRYDKLACVGVLVGSESNARARVAGLTHREIDYTPTPGDFQKLLKGLEVAGDIMFAAGADSVMPNTFKYYEFKSTKESNKMHEYIKDPTEITLGTGHPQGGNVIASSAETGVVNAEFKVFGYDNLFIADASVFPTSLGVNPQLTVMGLANYAVQFVKENRG